MYWVIVEHNETEAYLDDPTVLLVPKHLEKDVQKLHNAYLRVAFQEDFTLYDCRSRFFGFNNKEFKWVGTAHDNLEEIVGDEEYVYSVVEVY